VVQNVPRDCAKTHSRPLEMSEDSRMPVRSAGCAVLLRMELRKHEFLIVYIKPVFVCGIAAFESIVF